MASRWLLQLLLLIALVLAPVCGMGGRALASPMGEASQATQHHGMSPEAGHCDQMAGQEDNDSPDRGTDADCRVMACAGVLTPTARLAETFLATSARNAVPVSVAASGLNSAAEPPPPRLL